MNLEFNTLLNSAILVHLFLIRLLAKREMMFSFFSSAIVVDECLMNIYLSVMQYITALFHHFIKIIR